jgi:hypothetical protein
MHTMVAQHENSMKHANGLRRQNETNRKCVLTSSEREMDALLAQAELKLFSLCLEITGGDFRMDDNH